MMLQQRDISMEMELRGITQKKTKADKSYADVEIQLDPVYRRKYPETLKCWDWDMVAHLVDQAGTRQTFHLSPAKLKTNQDGSVKDDDGQWGSYDWKIIGVGDGDGLPALDVPVYQPQTKWHDEPSDDSKPIYANNLGDTWLRKDRSIESQTAMYQAIDSAKFLTKEAANVRDTVFEQIDGELIVHIDKFTDIVKMLHPVYVQMIREERPDNC